VICLLPAVPWHTHNRKQVRSCSEVSAEQDVPVLACGAHSLPVCCCCASQLTPLPRLSIDFSGHRQTYSSSGSYARASSIRRSLDRCSMMPDDAAAMFRSSSWELAEEQVSSSGLVGCASLQLQQQLPTLAVGETTESLGLGELPSGLGFIEDVINETHLLQVRCAGWLCGCCSLLVFTSLEQPPGPRFHPPSLVLFPATQPQCLTACSPAVPQSISGGLAH
jgi:hypothetical protein